MNERDNMNERKLAVFCMEYLARQINDESVFELWLSSGVADGDFEYNEFTLLADTLLAEKLSEIDDYYLEKENFADLMTIFTICMKQARKSGGLFCGGVCSRDINQTM